MPVWLIGLAVDLEFAISEINLDHYPPTACHVPERDFSRPVKGQVPQASYIDVSNGPEPILGNTEVDSVGEIGLKDICSVKYGQSFLTGLPVHPGDSGLPSGDLRVHAVMVGDQSDYVAFFEDEQLVDLIA